MAQSCLSLLPCLGFFAKKGGTCWGRGRRGRGMTKACLWLVSQDKSEHSQGQCSGCKIVVEAAQLNVLWHRCSSWRFYWHFHSRFPMKIPKELSPTLSPTVTINSASPYSKSDFVRNRSKALSILEAHSGNFSPFRLGLHNQIRLQENSSHNSTETVLKKSSSHLFSNKPSQLSPGILLTSHAFRKAFAKDSLINGCSEV